MIFIDFHWFFQKKGSYVKMVCMSIFKVPVRVSVLHKIVPFCSVPNCSCSVPFWVRHYYPYRTLFRIEPYYLERKLNRVFVPVNCTLILPLPAISSSFQWFLTVQDFDHDRSIRIINHFQFAFNYWIPVCLQAQMSIEF